MDVTIRPFKIQVNEEVMREFSSCLDPVPMPDRSCIAWHGEVNTVR
jgi:hypothetical protein